MKGKCAIGLLSNIGKCAIGLLSNIGKCAVVCCFLRTFRGTLCAIAMLSTVFVRGLDGSCVGIISRVDVFASYFVLVECKF